MVAKPWPLTLFPSSVDFEIAGQSASGGRSDTGFEQPVVGSAGYLTARLVFQGLRRRKPEQVLDARAMKAHMRGRANTILIDLYDRFSPGMLADGDARPIVEPTDDDDYFDDGYGIESPRTPALSGLATMGESSLLVFMVGHHAPRAGQWFGLKAREAHLISDAVRYIDDPNTDYWMLTFTPPLRADVENGEVVAFDKITVEMRATSDQVAALDFSFPPTFSNFTLDLVEAAS